MIKNESIGSWEISRLAMIEFVLDIRIIGYSEGEIIEITIKDLVKYYLSSSEFHENK